MKHYRLIYTWLRVAAAFGAAPVAGAAPDDRFHGGALDGAAAGFSIGYTPPSGGEFGRFVGGGGYDGYASAVFLGYTPPAPGSEGRFLGGGFDGYAGATAPGLPNPLDGDSDGDGVPDWWESRHYFSLSLADGATDIDGDGQGSLFEYLADNDPKNAGSRLAIITIDRGAQVMVAAETTSVNRVYWIEASESLQPADWSPATVPSVPGNGGVLAISFPDAWERSAYFRLRVALPP